MEVSTTYHEDNGPGFSYKYDLIKFEQSDLAFIVRSYRTEPDEAHFLAKEIDRIREPIQKEDLELPLFTEAVLYLRQLGKTQLNYLSQEQEGYVKII